MNKVAVVYWSGTGNTQAMAEAVANAAGAELFTADAFSGEKLDAYDAIGFGCPSMGSEQLEESEFEPMFEGCKSHLAGKRIALFGSYGWGDGEWMRNWEAECLSLGANMVCECVICQETPDEEALAACEAPGNAGRGGARRLRGAGQGAGGSVGRKNGMGGCFHGAAAVCLLFSSSPPREAPLCAWPRGGRRPCRVRRTEASAGSGG